MLEGLKRWLIDTIGRLVPTLMPLDCTIECVLCIRLNTIVEVCTALLSRACMAMSLHSTMTVIRNLLSLIIGAISGTIST